jgi:hypothetical protein
MRLTRRRGDAEIFRFFPTAQTGDARRRLPRSCGPTESRQACHKAASSRVRVLCVLCGLCAKLLYGFAQRRRGAETIWRQRRSRLKTCPATPIRPPESRTPAAPTASPRSPQAPHKTENLRASAPPRESLKGLCAEPAENTENSHLRRNRLKTYPAAPPIRPPGSRTPTAPTASPRALRETESLHCTNPAREDKS